MGNHHRPSRARKLGTRNGKMTSQPPKPSTEHGEELPARSKSTTTCNVSISSCIDPVAVPNCECGEPAGVRTSQTVKNPGRQFFGCRKDREDVRRCTFFQWCDDTLAKPSKPVATSKMTEEEVEASELQRSGSGLIKAGVCQSGVGDGRGSDKDVASKRNPQCFECGQYGHLARECTFRLESLAEEVNEAEADANVCFKCQKPGHWARDCPLNAAMASVPPAGGDMGGDVCFKCNQPGHWARECPLAAGNSGHGRSAQGNSRPSSQQKEMYACLRCGNTGHWAKDCTKPWRDDPIDVMGVETNVPAAGTRHGGGEVAKLWTTGGRREEQQKPAPATANHDQNVCFKCNQPGHWASECPQNAAVRASADVNKRDVYPCLRCGKTGHWAQNCTQPWRDEPLDVVGMNTEAVIIETAPRGTDAPDAPEAPDDPERLVDSQRPSIDLEVDAPPESDKPAHPMVDEKSPKETVDIVPIPPEKAAPSRDLPQPPAPSLAERKSPSATPPAQPARVSPPSPKLATDTDSSTKRQSRDAIEMPPPKNQCVRQHTGPAIDIKKLPLSMRGGGGWDVRKS